MREMSFRNLHLKIYTLFLWHFLFDFILFIINKLIDNIIK